MKRLLILIVIGGVLGCPKPAPPLAPVAPPIVPADPTCGLAMNDHDDLVDAVVGDLQGGDAQLTAERARYSTATVGCVVAEILGDVHNAPDLIAAATAWRNANP